MPYITTFLHSQLMVTLPPPNADYSGQVVIVTGSNTGLGLDAVRHLIRLNAAKVILAVRTVSKGEAAVQTVVSESKCDTKRLEVWQLDLSKAESIKAFGKRVQAMDRLDALCQNAGILTGNWVVEEGHESHITVNVIGAALLGLEVLPKLRESAKKTGLTGRLGFVGSDLQYIAKFDEKKATGSLFAALDEKSDAHMADRYNVSKLLLLFYVRALAQSSPVSPESNVIIDYCTPGACKSDIFRDEVGKVKKMMMNIGIGMLARTTEEGSRTLMHSISPTLTKEQHGKFLMDCKVFPNGSNVDGAKNEQLAERFIGELYGVLDSIDPGVTRNARP